MEHYVTLFDSFFLPQGLALHRSLQRHCAPFKLWILCVDQQVYDVLTLLELDDVHLLNLAQYETESLKQVKPYRTVGEYCWTLTPFAPRFVFETDASVDRVTYLDADLWFRKSPCAVFSELEKSSKQVLITDHGYSPEWDQSATSGQFCVQFVTFTRNGGEAVRGWWEERCIEWCYNRLEKGRFGDQKYLDDWPVRFKEKVHVLSDKELALAPWNASRFPYGNAVFWHFHGLRIVNTNLSRLSANLGGYSIPAPALDNIYRPYLTDLRWALELLASHGFFPLRQAKISLAHKYIELLRSVWCLVRSIGRWRFVRF